MTPLLGLLSLIVLLNLGISVMMLHAFIRTMRGDVDSIADDHDTIFQRMLDDERSGSM